MSRVLSLDSASEARAYSIEDILVETLLPLNLKQREQHIDFRVVDAKTRVKIPRETIVSVIDAIVSKSGLFPQTKPLIVKGDGNQRRYQVSFVSPCIELSEEQAAALKTYRQTIVGGRSNQPMDLYRARLIVEYYGG